MSEPNRVGRAWLRDQTRLARRGAFPAIVVGLANAGLAVVQAACAAMILGAALAGGALGVGWALAGFVVMALLRAGLIVVGDRLATEAGSASRRRLRSDA